MSVVREYGWSGVIEYMEWCRRGFGYSSIGDGKKWMTDYYIHRNTNRLSKSHRIIGFCEAVCL